MQHVGDLIVDSHLEQSGQVTGTTFVRSGGNLVCHGQLAGGLIVDKGGQATLNGQVARNIVNNGKIWLYGQVAGQCLGNPPENTVGPDQIIGKDLHVPFDGPVSAYSTGD